MSRWAGALAALATLAVCTAAAAPAYRWDLPKGVAPPPVPADNPMSDAKVELGRRLFYDADLSVDGTLACATCHEQRHGFAEGEAVHAGVRGARGRRNVMTLANVGYFAPLTWADPGARTLEGQMITPLTGDRPVEMGMKGQEAELVRRLSSDACYKTMFAQAFPGQTDQVSFANTTKALAAFERTLISLNAPYDRAARGDRAAMSDDALAGERVFKAKGCGSCHAGPNFTDEKFHVITAPKGEDHGLMEKTGKPADDGAFRTPSLRNIALSAPYLHNGRAPTLAAAILAHDSVASTLKPEDVFAIEAFLGSLTDQAFVTDPKLSLPRSLCGVAR